MSTKNFTHLHVHTEYSLLDGAARIGELLDAAKNFGMTSVAITDHGTMYGVVEFYKAAVKRGIKPIIGCEVYVAPKSRLERDKTESTKYNHLVLLAENDEGYKNLVKLASLAGTDGFYYRPRVDKDILRKYRGGLIALSACVYGEIARAILNENFSRARAVIAEYVEIFGRDNFFLEIQNHGREDEEKVRAALKIFAAEFDLSLVATNDLHYVRREDAEFHELLFCLQTGKTVEERGKQPLEDEYYLKSADEMRELFADTPDACDNTLKIAERCNVTLEFGKFQMPQFPLPAGYADAADYLRELCREKISDRYEILTDEISARLERELKIIHGMGYDGYFLIVQDFINFARSKKIPVGPGRGSAAGSIVAYVLGITELDPLKYGLLFERFLNPERVTLPDIDIDICYKRRDEVIDYVRTRYGADKISQIVTFGTMAAKAAIRDVTRVLGHAFKTSSDIVKLVPNVLNITIDEALRTSKELRAAYESNADEGVTRKIIDFARKLEGLPRHISVHAAGVVISKVPLDEIVPLQNSNDGSDLQNKKSRDVRITQYDKDTIEELGLMKMDFLGLRTLTIIADALANIKKTRGIELEPAQIPLRDEKTAAMLCAGDTSAVFQMESAGMTAMVRELRPECFEDLIPTVALYRPGPLGSGMVEDFIAGKHGRRVANYLHPKLEPILKETFGVILYQEQVMQIVQTLAGFTLGQADILRRAMAKKKSEILLAQKENFLLGCAANGVEKFLAEKIFDLLGHFADYGFNKSHSAAYGLLAWQTAYLKAHYPAEYMAAMMSGTSDIEKISAYIELARRMGIKVLGPDINSVQADFTVDGNAIHFGLAAVKSAGDIAVESIINERERGKFKSLQNFCGRIDPKKVSRRVLENLIKCGAFDSLDGRRDALLKALDSMMAFGSQSRQARESGAINLFDDDELSQAELVIPDAEGEDKASDTDILAWEKETLGIYLTGHPLKKLRESFPNLATIAQLLGKVGKRVKVGGIINNVRRLITRRGDTMAILTLETFDGTIEVTVFPKIFSVANKNEALLKNKVVVVEGRIDSSNDKLQLIADAVAEAETYAPDFWLTLPASLDTPATFDALQKIFDEYSGASRVFLNRHGQWIKTAQKIADGPLLRGALKNLLGEENVRLY